MQMLVHVEMGDKIKGLAEDVDSKLKVGETKCEENLGKMTSILNELQG
jgi:hypothetical protein